MEFFLVEISLKESDIEETAIPGCELFTLPHASFCWAPSSRLVDIQTQARWTVFLWGSANFVDEMASRQDVTAKIVDELNRTGSLKSVLAKLEGGFGVIAWNEQTRELQFATDPIGMTRMYYSVRDGKIIISSHAQLIARKREDFTISSEGLSVLFSLNGIPAPRSIFQDILVLKPSELKTFFDGGSRSKDYWNLLDQIVPYKGSFVDARDDFERLLKESLQRITFLNRAPIGVSMSGGVDSALIAGLLVNLGIAAQGVTVGYNPPTRFDETESASENGRLIGLPIEVLRVSDRDIAAALDQAIKSIPEPLGDATILPQLLMAAAVKGKTASIIDGTGADNIFGGMVKFSAERYARHYLRIPKSLRVNLIRPLLNALPSSKKSAITDQIRRMQKFSYGIELPEDLQKVYWSRFLPQEVVEKIILPAWEPDGYLADKILLGLREQVPLGLDDFLTSTYTSVRGTMPIYATQKLICLQYASGTVFRMPFTSPKMIEFALSLPSSYKLAGRDTKLVLRSAAAKLLPPDCTKRKKANFSPPIGRWLTGVFKEEFMSLLQDNTFFANEEIKKMLAEQSSGWRDWQWQLWTVFIFLKWLRSVSE